MVVLNLSKKALRLQRSLSEVNKREHLGGRRFKTCSRRSTLPFVSGFPCNSIFPAVLVAAAVVMAAKVGPLFYTFLDWSLSLNHPTDNREVHNHTHTHTPFHSFSPTEIAKIDEKKLKKDGLWGDAVVSADVFIGFFNVHRLCHVSTFPGHTYTRDKSKSSSSLSSSSSSAMPARSIAI